MPDRPMGQPQREKDYTGEPGRPQGFSGVLVWGRSKVFLVRQQQVWTSPRRGDWDRAAEPSRCPCACEWRAASAGVANSRREEVSG